MSTPGPVELVASLDEPVATTVAIGIRNTGDGVAGSPRATVGVPTLPVGVTLAPRDGDWTCVPATGGLSCSADDIAPDGRTVLVLDVVAQPTLRNVASTVQLGVVVDGRPHVVPLTVRSAPQELVARFVPGDPILPGARTVTLELTNTGGTDATAALVELRLPTGVGFPRAVLEGWAGCPGDAVEGVLRLCRRADVPLGDLTELSVALQVPSDRIGLDGRAVVAVVTSGPSTATATLRVQVPAGAPALDVVVEEGAVLVAGEDGTVTFEVRNTGTGEARGLRATVQRQRPVQWTSGGGRDGWTCVAAAGDTADATCTSSSTLAPGEVSRLDVVVQSPNPTVGGRPATVRVVLEADGVAPVTGTAEVVVDRR